MLGEKVCDWNMNIDTTKGDFVSSSSSHIIEKSFELREYEEMEIIFWWV